MLEPVHIMLDNETLSVLPNAHIVQAAIVHFDPHNFEVLDTRVLSLEHDKRQPCSSVEPATVAWWMKRPREIQASVFYGDEDRLSVRAACCEFYRFVVDACRRIWQEDDTPGLSDLHYAVNIWAKPARFDVPQWEHAFRNADVQVPWFRRNVNDLQSLLNEALRNGFDYADVDPAPAQAHMPLNDCLWQIRLLKAITEFNSK